MKSRLDWLSVACASRLVTCSGRHRRTVSNLGLRNRPAPWGGLHAPVRSRCCVAVASRQFHYTLRSIACVFAVTTLICQCRDKFLVQYIALTSHEFAAFNVDEPQVLQQKLNDLVPLRVLHVSQFNVITQFCLLCVCV